MILYSIVCWLIAIGMTIVADETIIYKLIFVIVAPVLVAWLIGRYLEKNA